MVNIQYAIEAIQARDEHSKAYKQIYFKYKSDFENDSRFVLIFLTNKYVLNPIYCASLFCSTTVKYGMSCI